MIVLSVVRCTWQGNSSLVQDKNRDLARLHKAANLLPESPLVGTNASLLCILLPAAGIGCSFDFVMTSPHLSRGLDNTYSIDLKSESGDLLLFCQRDVMLIVLHHERRLQLIIALQHLVLRGELAGAFGLGPLPRCLLRRRRHSEIDSLARLHQLLLHQNVELIILYLFLGQIDLEFVLVGTLPEDLGIGQSRLLCFAHVLVRAGCWRAGRPCGVVVTSVSLDLVQSQRLRLGHVMILFRFSQVGLSMEKGRRLLEGLVRRRDRSQALPVGQALLGLIKVRDDLAVLVFDYRGLVKRHRFLLSVQIQAGFAKADVRLVNYIHCRSLRI